jgi:hypothetical protein
MLTTLDAVNIILNSIGEAPVSSVNSGLAEAEAAEARLLEVSREVQAKGWSQNHERSITLVRNNSGQIPIPKEYLRVDTTGIHSSTDVTVRTQNARRFLYNRGSSSFKFDQNMICDVVLQHDYENLSIELQNYIAYRAARKFQESQMGSTSLDAFAKRNEEEAWAALLDAESEAEDSNILTDSAYMVSITGRFNPLSGR